VTLHRFTRQLALVAGGAAIIGMGTLTACSSSTKEEAPTTSKSSSSPAPAPSPNNTAPGMPNEKGMDPKNPNSFAPTVKAPPAPTAEPG